VNQRAPLLLATAAALLAACAEEKVQEGPQLPPLPKLELKPMLPVLQQVVAQRALPDEGKQRELREYGDIALQLVEADDRTAMRAERALLEDPLCWFVLEPALAHDEVAVRQRAAWLCGLSGQAALQVPLLKRLKYELDAMTVVWVADALCKLGNDHGIGWLSAAMSREATRDQAGQLAIDALRARAADLPESPSWEDLHRLCAEATAQWQRTGETTLENAPAPDQTELDARLAELMQTPASFQLRPVDDARYILRSLGKHGLPMMVATLQAEELKLRTMPLQELANLGRAARSTANDVMALLGDPLTSLYAVRTLGEIGATEALPHLRALLGDFDTDVRAAATMAVGVLEDEQSRPTLEAMLQDESEALDVRVNAAFALLCLGEHAAAEAFLAEREQKKDYHESTLTQLREQLAARKQ